MRRAMSNRIRFVVLAVCIAIAFPIGVPTAQATQCRIAKPTHQPGHWWSWRLIDGRKCWYEGKTMVSKSSLHWSVPLSRESRATPVSVRTERRNDLLDSRASATDDADSFESLWRARAIKN